MEGYLLLAAAIFLEFFGTTFMKSSDGFTKIIFSAGTLICYCLCFYALALSLKTIQLNIAYATWGGLGIILSAAVSYFYFHESITFLGLVGIILIVVGVILCNFFGTGH